MKKSIKILTLVLSLALLCGALVVAAFAEDTTEIVGIRLDVSADMEDPMVEEIPTVTSGNVETKFDKDDGAAQALAFKHQVGGKPVLATAADGNHYVTVNWGTETSKDGHFLHSYIKNGWGAYEPSKNAEYLDDFKYFVYDFDISFYDPANYSSNGFLLPYVTRAKDNAGAAQRNDIGDANFKANILKSEGKVYMSLVGNSDDKGLVGDGENWHHVTYIIGAEVIDDNGDENMKANIYLAVDGKIVATKTWINDLADDASYQADRTLIGIMGVRLDAFGKGVTSGNVDNVVARTLTNDYNGNLATVLAGGKGADLTAWESNLYDPDNMPFGKLLAKVGDTPFDSMEKAIAAAAEGSDPIVLCDNVASPVVVNEIVTIECGEYTIADITAGQGYRLNYDEETKTYTSETAQGVFYITWEACECGLDDCDDTHPGGIDTEGWEGGTIGASYTKDHNWAVASGASVYSLAGWVDEDGNPVDMNTIITTEMCEDISEIVLYPVIETVTPSFCYTTADGVAYTDDFKSALNNVVNGGTITLMKDATFLSGATTTIGKDVTVDLNGHILNCLADAKFNYLSVSSGKTLTFLGEKEGSTVVHANWNVSQKRAASTFLTSGNATMKFIGPNLTVSVAALYGNWGSSTINIEADGVHFAHAGAGDNPAHIYHKGSANITLKNCVIESTNPFVGLTNSAVESNVLFENSASLKANLIAEAYNNANLTVKNSYVSGNVYCAKEMTVEGECFFTHNNWAEDATLGEGLTLTAMTGIAKLGINTHKWVINEDNTWNVEETLKFAVEDREITPAFTTAKTLKLEVTDGETVRNTLNTLPGMKVLALEEATPIVDGWFKQATKYWYTVAEDATADIKVDIADITDVARGAIEVNKPAFYVNYTLSDNLTTNLYVPAELPEGVEITEIVLNGSSRNRTLSGNFTIGGAAYKVTQGWPNAWDADDGLPVWDVYFTYGGNDYTVKFTANVFEYVQKVVDIYAEDTEKLQQATALLQYVEAANKIKGDTLATGLSEYLDELQEKVTLPAIPTEYVSNLTALLPYIQGATIGVNSSRGGSLIFTVTEKAKTDAVGIKIKSEMATAGSNYTKVEGVDTITVADTVLTDNVNMTYWAAEDLTIEILDAEGTVIATGTYSLAAYYNETKASLTEDQVALAEAMYALAYIGNVNN